jgi:hypothetical protein
MSGAAVSLFSRAGKVILIIATKPDGVFLYEYREDGRIFDTWHRTVDDAKHQATYYFGDTVEAWRPVPDYVSDLHTFAREIAREQS